MARSQEDLRNWSVTDQEHSFPLRKRTKILGKITDEGRGNVINERYWDKTLKSTYLLRGRNLIKISGFERMRNGGDKEKRSQNLQTN